MIRDWLTFDVFHRLRHGHWPDWEPVEYDFLTWRYICGICARGGPS